MVRRPVGLLERGVRPGERRAEHGGQDPSTAAGVTHASTGTSWSLVVDEVDRHRLHRRLRQGADRGVVTTGASWSWWRWSSRSGPDRYSEVVRVDGSQGVVGRLPSGERQPRSARARRRQARPGPHAPPAGSSTTKRGPAGRSSTQAGHRAGGVLGHERQPGPVPTAAAGRRAAGEALEDPLAARRRDPGQRLRQQDRSTPSGAPSTASPRDRRRGAGRCRAGWRGCARGGACRSAPGGHAAPDRPTPARRRSRNGQRRGHEVTEEAGSG